MRGDLVLASGSPYRRRLLERLGLPFRVREPGVDEDEYKSRSLPPERLAEALAIAKATALSEAEPGATLIGGDQLVAFEEEILGKPGSPEAAIEQLRRLAGRQHRLVTALAVWSEGMLYSEVDIAELRMRPLSDEAIRRYVECDRPTDCAGAYKLEERGIVLFEEILAKDHTAITGLPLIALTKILVRIGFSIP